jgi:hypothetical protein
VRLSRSNDVVPARGWQHPYPIERRATPAETQSTRGGSYDFGSALGQELGRSGLRQSGGIIQEEFVLDLRGRRGMKTYADMGTDPVCAAMLFALGMTVRSVGFDVQAADDGNAAGEAKQFVEECMGDMSHSFDDTISEACTMFQFGFAPLEIVWKLRRGPDEEPEYRSKFTDGRIAPRKMPLRKQETLWRWDFDETGGIQAFQQDLSGTGLQAGGVSAAGLSPYGVSGAGNVATIPIERLLLFRTSVVANNPEGVSVLRGAYRPWWIRRRIEEFEAIGVERDLAGLPYLKAPSRIMSPNALVEEKLMLASLVDMLRQVRRDTREGIILPSDRDDKGNLDYELTLLSSSGQKAIDTDKIVSRHAKFMAMTILADFIFLGQQSVGSYALSTDKTELFNVAATTWAANIAEIFNRHWLPRMWRLNGLPVETMPKIAAGNASKFTLKDLAAYVTALAGAGMPLFPDPDLENFLREAAGMPPAPEDGVIDPQLLEAARAALEAQRDAAMNANNPAANPGGTP